MIDQILFCCLFKVHENYIIDQEIVNQRESNFDRSCMRFIIDQIIDHDFFAQLNSLVDRNSEENYFMSEAKRFLTLSGDGRTNWFMAAFIFRWWI